MREKFIKFAKRIEFTLLLVIVCLSVFLSLTTEDFFSVENLFDLLSNYSFLGILSMGLVVVLISGGVDISFTATATVAQYIMATVIIQAGGGWPVAFLLPILIGISLGLVNAVLVYYLRVHSIIITIATLNTFYGVLIFITRGKWIYNFPDWFCDGITLFQFSTADGMVYTISLPIMAFVLVVAVTAFILNKTSVGRQVYAMGGNMDAARRMGFHLLHLHLFVYGYMGLLAGLAGMVQAQLVQTVAPNSIFGRELEVVAAVVIGGASMNGGVGTILGTILGVTLIAVMSNGLTLLGISSYWHQVLIGLVILASVSVTAYNEKWRQKGSAKIDV